MLQSGSVRTTRGAVFIGNGSEDRKVEIDIGIIPADEEVLISFIATVNYVSSSAMILLKNQGVVRSNEAPDLFTDDPRTNQFGDVTEQEAQLEQTLVYLPMVSRDHLTCSTEETKPTDVMLVIDRSRSMGNEGKLAAAVTAAGSFLDGMNFTQDQAGICLLLRNG